MIYMELRYALTANLALLGHVIPGVEIPLYLEGAQYKIRGVFE